MLACHGGSFLTPGQLRRRGEANASRVLEITPLSSPDRIHWIARERHCGQPRADFPVLQNPCIRTEIFRADAFTHPHDIYISSGRTNEEVCYPFTELVFCRPDHAPAAIRKHCI